MPERLPPTPPDKPKFRVGDTVRINQRRREDPGIGKVVKIVAMTQEDLVRTAYAAGFWTYTVRFATGELEVSGNLLDLAVIDTLGGLVGGV